MRIMGRTFRAARPLVRNGSEPSPDRTGLSQAPGAVGSATFPLGSGGGGIVALGGPGLGGPLGGGPRIALGGGFAGTVPSETPYTPPDTQGDVSPTQVLVGVNGRIKVFDKAGNVGALNTNMDNFFLSVAGAGGVTNPRVRWDRLTGRWIVLAITLEGANNKVVLAVSDSGTIDASTTFSFFSFAQGIGGGDAAQFADSPTLGVDRSALYIGTNQFGSTTGGFQGSDGFVVRKSSLTPGGAPVVTHFRGLCGAGTPGPYTPQGVDNDDPNATEGYFVGVDNGSYGLLQLRRVSDPGGTPTISGNVPLTVPATSYAAPTPQPGTTMTLDVLDDRLLLAKIQTNSLTGRRTLWTAHSIGVDASGVATGNGRAGSRWYQIGGYASGATPSLVQAGTAFDPSGTDPNSVFVPSIVQNLQGHALLGASYGGAALSTGARAFARLSGDAPGTLPQSFPLVTGSGSYSGGGSPSRWGEYSMASVDPSDGMTFWTFQEYVVSGGYGVWVQRILSDPPVATSATGNAARRGGSASVSVAGTGFFDPPAGYPNHLGASVAGGDVAVGAATFLSPSSVGLTLGVGASAALGARTVTIANPDGQTTTVSFTVLPVLLTGTVVYGDYPQAAKPPVTLEILAPGTETVLDTRTIAPANDGTFSLEPSALAAGTYDLRVRAAHFLRRRVNGVDLSGGAATFAAGLVNGDVNNDNVVTIADVNAFRSALGTSAASPNWNPNADLNGDGFVTIADLNILRGSLGRYGD